MYYPTILVLIHFVSFCLKVAWVKPKFLAFFEGLFMNYITFGLGSLTPTTPTSGASKLMMLFENSTEDPIGPVGVY